MGVFERLPGYAQDDEPSIRAQTGGGRPAASFVDAAQSSPTAEQAVRARRTAAEPLPEPRA